MSLHRLAVKHIKRIYSSRHLLWEMTVKKIKAQYAASLTGIGVAIVNPLLLAFVIIFVFSYIIRIEIDNFPLFIISGIFPWLFFSSALFDATMSFLVHKNILHQFNIPKELIPISVVFAHCFNFIVGLVVMMPFFYLLNHRVLLFIPLLAAVIILHFIFVVGLGMMFSLVNVFFRDFVSFLSTIIMLWLWITPVFYPLDFVPDKLRIIFRLNPMTSFIDCYRIIIFQGKSPSFCALIEVVLWSLVCFLTGVVFFDRFESRILKRI